MNIDNFDKIVSDLKIDLLLNNREIFGVIASRMNISLAKDNSEDSLAYTDGTDIYFYPNQFYSLTYRNVEFIIGHELLHLILDHLTRKEDKDPIIWNFACDYCVNDLLYNNVTNGKRDPIGEMPPETLYDDRYYGLSAEEIYELLIKEGGNSHIKIKNKGSGNYEVSDLRKKKTDVHNENGNVEPEVEKQFLVEVASDIDKCVSKSNSPSCITRGISKIKKAKYNWKHILEKYMKSLIKTDSTWRRPSKRGVSLGIYLPSIKKEQMIKVGVAVDVSGSVSENQLQQLISLIYSSLFQIKNFEIYVWLFSGIVHKETMIKITPNKRDNLKNIKYISNGSTDIKANIDFVESQKELKDLDLLLIMTDGYDYLDNMKYKKNLLWGIIGNDGFKNPKGCKNGKVIYFPQERKNNY